MQCSCHLFLDFQNRTPISVKWWNPLLFNHHQCSLADAASPKHASGLFLTDAHFEISGKGWSKSPFCFLHVAQLAHNSQSYTEALGLKGMCHLHFRPATTIVSVDQPKFGVWLIMEYAVDPLVVQRVCMTVKFPVPCPVIAKQIVNKPIKTCTNYTRQE